MKKFVLSIVFMLMGLSMIAQSNPNFIAVNGTYKYAITPKYKAKMTVSMANVYYDQQTTSLLEIKSSYLDKLAKVGIRSDRLKQDDLYYAMMGYDKEGTIVEFSTESVEEMKKFLLVKSIGVTKTDAIMEAQLSEAEMAEYAKKAYDQAKRKAEGIAAKIGRKIGKAVSINDSNSNKINESLYYGSNFKEKDYYIAVSFELL